MKKQIISKIDPLTFYNNHIPSLEKVSDTEATGICPFCHDPDKTFEAVLFNKNFICDKCGESGNPINFFRLIEKKSEPEALRALAQEMGIAFSEDDPELVEKVEKVEKIEDINKDLIPICPFPLETLPTEFGNTVEKVASFFDVENGFVAGTMLAIVSGAIGNSVLISAKADYEAPIFIWFIVIAESGFGKSPAMNLFMEPILLFKNGSLEITTGTSSNGNPKLKHFAVSDTTVEALALVFKDDPRGIILHKDELSGLILGMNQYKSKGNDRQQYLQLFDCKPWSINRVERGSIFVPKTGAAIIGGIQPGIMTKVFNSESFEDGLIYRFILDCPEFKPRRFNREIIASENKKYWGSLLRQCYNIPFFKSPNTCGSFEYKKLSLGDEALTCFESFYNEYNSFVPHLSNMARGFIPKLITYALKFAGLNHVIQQIENKEDIGSSISADTMERAITLTRYYAGQAMKLVKIYTEDMDSQTKRILTILSDLRDQVHNGRLPMKKIQEAYNQGLGEQFQIKSNKMLGTKLKYFGLETKLGTGGLTDLVWDEGKIRGILP